MSFIQEIENIEDHRVDANKDYELADIIFLTIAAVLCGAKGWKARLCAALNMARK